MPPKRQFNDDDEDPTTSEEETTDEETTDESSDGTSEASQEVPINGPPSGGAAGAPPASVSAVDRSGGGRNIANNPHDEAFDVEDDERVPTPGKGGPSAAAGGARPSGAQAGRIENNPHDEAFDVADGDEVITPTRNEGKGTGGAASAAAAGGDVPKGMIKNGSHDEFSDVEDDMEEDSVPTPNKASGPATGAAGAASGAGAVSGSTIKNNPHDMAFDVDGSSVGSPENMSPARDRGAESSEGSPVKRPEALGRMNAIPDEDDSDVSSDVSTDDDDDAPPGGRFGDIEKAAAVAATGLPDYNPNDYAHLNAKLPPDVVDLFNLISAYQPQEMELPTKFRPFVPDYIPCVGEIDTFCKVPRPDGIPDNLGTIVVDEPSAKQSNPAVVMIGLGHSSKVAAKSTFVDSLKNAHENPNAIDDWITQIKGLHAKKPLPTVNYSRPMPEIDVLLQAWPQEFEDVISSDVQFPPPQIDLDIEQYVRLLCSLLDIPIYNNVIESLHVMFTLYLEFRSNQHFQHA